MTGPSSVGPTGYPPSGSSLGMTSQVLTPSAGVGLLLLGVVHRGWGRLEQSSLQRSSLL